MADNERTLKGSQCATHAIHPETKYEARLNALDAADCPGCSSPWGGFAGLVEIPYPKSRSTLTPANVLGGLEAIFSSCEILGWEESLAKTIQNLAGLTKPSYPVALQRAPLQPDIM